MRTTRFVSILVALVLAVSMQLAFTSTVEAQAKPRHDLTASGKEIGNTGKFKAFGKVTTYKGRKIIIQRKLRGQSFKLYKKDRTNRRTGKFSTRIDGPIGSCFKVVVPSTKNYRTTKQRIGCIVKA